MPTFDPTISLGVVLHLIGLLITVITIFWKVSMWITAVQTKIWLEIHSLHTSHLEALGRIDTRLGMLEVKVTDLWEKRK